jgi:hypothetical protein
MARMDGFCNIAGRSPLLYPSYVLPYLKLLTSRILFSRRVHPQGAEGELLLNTLVTQKAFAYERFCHTG